MSDPAAWIRCHVCFWKPSSSSSGNRNKKLFLLNCRHLVCGECATKAREPAHNKDGFVATCPMCHAKPVRSVELSGSNKVPPQIASLFSNQMKVLKQVQETAGFQTSQYNNLSRKMISALAKEKDGIQAKVQQENRRMGELTKELQNTNAELAELEAYKASLASELKNKERAKAGKGPRKPGSNSSGSERGRGNNASYIIGRDSDHQVAPPLATSGFGAFQLHQRGSRRNSTKEGGPASALPPTASGFGAFQLHQRGSRRNSAKEAGGDFFAGGGPNVGGAVVRRQAPVYADLGAAKAGRRGGSGGSSLGSTKNYGSMPLNDPDDFKSPPWVPKRPQLFK